jgi:MoaA/NifB/PqqE/SkfB family radical SAM enzyme
VRTIASPRAGRGGFASDAAKKLRLIRSFLTLRPTWCSWQITDKCNFRCSFCSAWRSAETRGEQSLEEIDASAQALRRMGTMVVSLTGGEPLMRKDLPAIVATIGRHHFTFVTTNGSLVTAQSARALAESGLWGVGVSLDYADPERHDAARGIEGAHRRAVEALRHLQAERIDGRPKVNLMFTLMNDNFGDLVELAELAQGIGCSFRVQPYSVLKTGDTSLVYRQPVSEELLKLRRRFSNFATNPVVLEKFDAALNGGVPDCVAGRYMLNIDPAGNVAKCPEDREHAVGHILRDDTAVLLRRLRERHRSNTCRECWYNCRNELEVSYTLRGMLRGGLGNFFGR